MSPIEIPSFLAHLPVDRHRRPVPWFVHWPEPDVPDFRVVGEGKLVDAYRFDLCWVCGKRRGRHAAFVIGPMCAINRVSPEPPSHLYCAAFSAVYCPFLATPSMRRRTTGLDGDLESNTAGVAIERNPGVALVWSSRTWAPRRVEQYDEAGVRTEGVLFNVGEPTLISAYAAGRLATAEELAASIESGLPILREACQRDRDPADSLAMLERQAAATRELLRADNPQTVVRLRVNA